MLLRDAPAIPHGLLDAMIAAAPRRGLDGVLHWQDGPAGMIRFAHHTTTESIGERQPFIGATGATLLFDGRLDNRGDVIALLGGDTKALATAPDGALALALYERRGRAFVGELIGDFAIVIYDASERRLSLFRSPLGWRPLYWTFDGNRFAAATDVKTLIVGLGLPRRLNEGALAEFLSGRFMTQTESFWASIERVEQGSALIFSNGRIERWQWHDGPFEDWSDRSFDDHVDEFRSVFDQALIAANRSDGPVTSHLSGGLDSSSVVCRSTELYRAGRLDRQIGAISARFPGEPHDESLWSCAVEEHLGITAEVSRSQPFSIEAANAWSADSYLLPIGPNALDVLAGALDLMNADGRRVLLTGEGGDDWLNGSLAHWPDLLMRGRWGQLARHGRSFWPGDSAPLSALKAFVTAARPVAIPRYRRAMLKPALDWRNPATDWLRPDWQRQTNVAERWSGPDARPGLRGFAQRARYGVFSHGNRSLIAETAFAYAESRGVEVRHPFHDARITRFAMGAAGIHLRDKTYRKRVLREAMRGTLPEIVRTRTSKAIFVGYSADAIDALLADRPVRDLLPVQFGWLDGERIEQLHAPFSAWRREGSSGPLPNSPWGPVWAAIAVDIWLRNAVGL